MAEASVSLALSPAAATELLSILEQAHEDWQYGGAKIVPGRELHEALVSLRTRLSHNPQPDLTEQPCHER